LEHLRISISYSRTVELNRLSHFAVILLTDTRTYVERRLMTLSPFISPPPSWFWQINLLW